MFRDMEQEFGPIDVHRYGVKLAEQENLLVAAAIKPANKRLIHEFIDWCKVDPKIGEARIIRYAATLRRIAELVHKTFKRMTDRDIMALLARVQDLKTPRGRPLSPVTIGDYRKTISKFWRWLYFDEYFGEAPPPIRRMNVGVPRSRKEPEIFTKEEIQKIIHGMTSPRNKAFFACLYDLQCRVTELLSRQLTHVRHTDDGDIQILIEADKTATTHWETLFESVPYFTTWLRLHPVPEDPNAPLWTMQKTDCAAVVSFVCMLYFRR